MTKEHQRSAVNPYLPLWEYIPDAEPHVFGDRVYIYGSHDRFGAPVFCVDDYVCWSAPLSDLSDWKREGVIFGRRDDPCNRLGIRCLYAPDVTRGPDGRYYLYYAYDFLGRIGVAVCDTPAGHYQFLGNVRYPDGHVWGTKSGEPFPFDPAVLTDDDGRVYLYSGFANPVSPFLSRFHRLVSEGGSAAELEPDMLTLKSEPKLLFPKKGLPGSFENHAFFEASSIRKVDGKYCFVYSSEHNHELCYAVSDAPLGPYAFKGTLVDLGDLYLDGNEDEKHAVNYLGNTHGGLLHAGNDWYIFYHRQTNQNSFCRQACAEKLQRDQDGNFLQARVTSCGLNDGPLPAKGTYPAAIACCLSEKEGTGRYDLALTRLTLAKHPYFTEGKDEKTGGRRQYIRNFRPGSRCAFRTFAGDGGGKIAVLLSGKAGGKLVVTCDDTPAAEIPVDGTGKERWCGADFRAPADPYTLTLTFEGEGKLTLYEVRFG